jgi:SAM-dependent methyltransferase
MKKITDQELNQQAKELSQQIITEAKSCRNETELRLKTYPLLENFAQSLDLNIESKHEYPLITGRADALYNRLIIEYKSPGVLQGDNAHKANQRAIEQTKGYILGLAEKQRKGSERYVAAILDGYYLIFLRFRHGRWNIDNPAKVTSSSMERFLRLLLNLSYGRALIPDNLVADFGEDTPISRSAVSALYQALKTSQSPRVHTLYEQWRNQFSEVCDYDKASKLKVPELGLKFGIKTREADPFPIFFSIHTYYAVFIKLLALQILRFYSAPGMGTDLMKVASFGKDELKSYMQKMEGGSIYHEAFGIANFLEADLFRWYLDAWDESIYDAARDIIGKLAQYSLQSLQQEHEEVRDLLKKLYHQLMPQRIRHNLGQYFTPDWLAERLLNMLEGGTFKGDPNTRLLDPSCGSGTFLVIAIEKIRNYAENKMLPEAEVLEKILQNIVGFDLDPLAVISARTNYLLALGDLINYRERDINIPVYLCDSILTPYEEGEKRFEDGTVQSVMGMGKLIFSTSVGNFALPSSLIDSRYIDELANLLEEAVNLELDKEQLVERITTRFPLIPDKDANDIKTICELYQKLLDLQKQGVNGIWARIIKNAFAPMFHRDFDYIAGNPPWVNWESLPENYRRATKKLWMDYGLFPHSGMDTILGKGKKDISMLMVYSAVDYYLKPKGKLGFVITQSVFKTSGAGQGFRKFNIRDKIPIRVLHVDDMVELNPFEGASNRTSIVILQRDVPMKYPMPSYLYWKKIKKGSIPTESELEDVQQMTKCLSWSAEPVDAKDETSSWLTGRFKAIEAVQKVMGKSEYTAHEGINSGGANAVYWVKILDNTPDGLVIIRNIIKGAKIKAEQVEYAIEPDLLYPLLRGRDVRRWRAHASAYIIMAQDAKKRRGIDENEMKMRYPKTYAYLKQFKDILKKRPAYKRYFNTAKDAFYSMFDVGDYTFAPYKVVWREQASCITACVISNKEGKTIIPDHKLMLIDFKNIQEAFYVSSLLNSSPSTYAIYSYCIETQMTPHIMNNIFIPKYDSSNELHRELAELSQQAHQAAAEDKREQVAGIEEQIDRLAARLWNLTDEEVNEITLSLKELLLK